MHFVLTFLKLVKMIVAELYVFVYNLILILDKYFFPKRNTKLVAFKER